MSGGKGLRMLGSVLAATVVVVVVMTVGVNAYYKLKPRDENLIEVRPSPPMLGDREREDLADIIGDNDAPPLPAAVKPLELPQIERAPLEGFVQLEVSVSDDGSVGEVRVIDAFPVGVYEQEAVESIRQRRFPISRPGTTETYVEVVEFEIPRDD